MRCLITGASGFVGGHIAEALTRRGWPVAAIVRPVSDAAFLEKLGVTILRGQISDASLVGKAVQETDAVIHCAAKVGDWGPVEEYRAANVDSLRVLLDACKGQPITRFVHMSSLGVYPMRHHHGSDETYRLPRKHWDGYSQSKVEAEQLVLKYYRDFGVPVVALRPGFVYGPRDRTVMHKLIQGLRDGKVRYPGGGHGAMNTIFVRNLVDAVLLALENQKAIGQVYNLTDGEYVSKRRFCETVADAFGIPHPTRTPPFWLAYVVTWWFEKRARMRGDKDPPKFNFPRLKFFGYSLDFSIDKARRELGYQPRVNFKDAMAETMAWYKQEMKA